MYSSISSTSDIFYRARIFITDELLPWTMAWMRDRYLVEIVFSGRARY
jgi:hypothetical protein